VITASGTVGLPPLQAQRHAASDKPSPRCSKPAKGFITKKFFIDISFLDVRKSGERTPLRVRSGSRPAGVYEASWMSKKGRRHTTRQPQP
jgi:hypothetical protein